MGAVLFDRSGGPTNPRTTPVALLDQQLDELLDGCLEPTAVAACFAGMAAPDTREIVGRYFAARFPTSVVRLESDYAPAFRSFGVPVDVCVIAGTGSLVCSRTPSGGYVTSGGKGYLLGDHGSAFRLGQLMVARFVEDTNSVDGLGARILDALGVTDPGQIVAAVHSSPTPAALLAHTAPLLTEAADRDHSWAQELVTEEMGRLAATLVGHVDRHHGSIEGATIGLAGGVWSSDSVVRTFESSVRQRGGDAVPDAFVRSDRPPVVGAIALAREALE